MPRCMSFAFRTGAPMEDAPSGLDVGRRAWLRDAACALTTGLPLVSLAHAATPGEVAVKPAQAVVLVYHRFADTAVDSMTVRKANFDTHLQAIKDAGGHVVPLADLLAFRQGRLAVLPPRPVVITADDGHRSQIEVMAPMMARTGWPVTLFIYPSAISNATYAMRWEDLRQLQDHGPFTIQSHTYWHPNFIKERRQQAPADFARFARTQLQRSKAVLEDRMGRPITQLAWPFGLFDEGVMEMAASAGYQAAMALGDKPCTAQDPIQALPRYLMVDAVSGKRVGQIIHNAFSPGA